MPGTKNIVGNECTSSSEVWALIEEEFEIGMPLAQGRDGTIVRRASVRLTGEACVLKIIPQHDPKSRARCRKEAQLQSRFNGFKNIVRFVKAWECSTEFIMALEFVAGGDLLDFVNNQPHCIGEEKAKYLARQLLVILEELHAKRVAHRDVKLDNILLSSSPASGHLQLKLADFGFADIETDENPFFTNSLGTVDYAAPELFRSATADGECSPYKGEPVDVFSSGVVIFALVCHVLPFESGATGLRQKRTGRLHIPSFVSPLCADFLRLLLHPDPSSRPSFSSALAHPWLSE